MYIYKKNIHYIEIYSHYVTQWLRGKQTFMHGRCVRINIEEKQEKTKQNSTPYTPTQTHPPPKKNKNNIQTGEEKIMTIPKHQQKCILMFSGAKQKPLVFTLQGRLTKQQQENETSY